MKGRHISTVIVERGSHLVESNNVVVLEHLQDLDFTVELAQVALVQLALVHYFDGHLSIQIKKYRLDKWLRCFQTLAVDPTSIQNQLAEKNKTGG